MSIDKDSTGKLSLITNIKPVEDREYYPLSPSQKGIFINNIEGDIGYNIPIIKVIEGNLDIERFKVAVETVVKKHEAFRTSFRIIDKQPVSIIHKKVDFQLEYIETKFDKEKDLIHNFIKPFDLSKPPLANSCLIKTEGDRYLFIFVIHHIICDGISTGILFKEIVNTYEGKPLPKEDIRYRDYSVWYDKLLETGYFDSQKKYWQSILKDEIPILNLSPDFPENILNDPKGEEIIFIINKELTNGLNSIVRKYIRKHNMTLYSLLFSIYVLLLAKYSGQNDIIVGSVSPGRNYKGLQNIIGVFINILPIRVKLNFQKTFIEYIDHVNERIMGAYNNQDLPFDKMIEHMSLIRKNSFNPIFDTMVTFLGSKELEENQANFGGLKLTNYNNINAYITSFGIKTDIYTTSAGEIEIIIDYNASLFKKERIEQMAKHYINIISQVIKEPEKRLSDINILSTQEEDKLLNDLNNTRMNYPKNISLNRLIEEQVKKTPNSIALVSEHGRLSFNELNKRANKVAWYLKQKGVGAGTIVGIIIERSLEMIIGILGILKAGAAYLPVDISCPQDRVNYIINNSNVSMILSHKEYREVVNCSSEVVFINDIVKNSSLPIDNLNLTYNPNRLMYVLYTSGSTGKPKGVMIKAHSFVNMINWYAKEFTINSNDCNLLIAPVSFDLAQKNLFANLITGGKLYLYPSRSYDYNTMSDIIEREKITLINCAPGVFYPLINFNDDTKYRKLSSLKYVFLGGESINLLKLKSWICSDNFLTQIVNTYGPTECTDIASYYRLETKNIDFSMPVPIGKPIYNVNLYILDKNMKLLPPGIDGELYIGGEGVGRGYYKDKEMTKERFIKCSYVPDKIYKTGDLARWLYDGNIEFRGRIDQQVKMRGYRIELEEIENVIIRKQGIKDVAVIDREDSAGSKYLCAYIVYDNVLNIDELKAIISRELPSYMIPSYFIKIDKLPLNPNGKIDRSSLPEFDKNEYIAKVYTKPESEMEEKIYKIWKLILNIEDYSVTENLFNLGANSLKIIVGASKIHKEIGIQVPMVEIFKIPTVRAISDYIIKEKKKGNKLGTKIIDFDKVKFKF